MRPWASPGSGSALDAGGGRSWVEVIVNWDGGEEHFSGLKPELGLGYADFAIFGTTYSLRLTERGEPVTDLVLGVQADSGERFWGAGSCSLNDVSGLEG
jgi:hypothetical protein